MVGVVSIGLFAGLMLTLVVILHRMWANLPIPAYVEAMQSFLPAAKGNPIITLITLLPILAPIVVLLRFGSDLTSTRFVFTLIGLVLACGPFLVTLRFNFPIYDTMMSWESANPPPTLPQTRMRFFILNLIRLMLASGAMFCFLLALLA